MHPPERLRAAIARVCAHAKAPLMSETFFEGGSHRRRGPPASVYDGTEALGRQRDAATGHVDQLCCSSPWALPMETADERRGKEAVRADEDVVAASEVRRLKERVRDLERMLGRKTLEVEILKEALDLARVKKPTLLSRSQAPEDTP